MKTLNFIALLICISTFLQGQGTADPEGKGNQFSILMAKGYRYVNPAFNNSNEWSNIGLEVQMGLSINDNVGLLIKSGWLKWSNNRETVIPVLIGPTYKIVDSGFASVTAYGNIGPMLVIGNDYAGVFAKYELGFQFSSTATKGLILGMSWGQDVVFHPSEYSVVKFSVGWLF